MEAIPENESDKKPARRNSIRKSSNDAADPKQIERGTSLATNAAATAKSPSGTSKPMKGTSKRNVLPSARLTPEEFDKMLSESSVWE